jgi:hypothetical protein
MTPTTLPELASDYPLSPEQIADFARTGHAYLPGVASPEELAPYRREILDVVERFKSGVKPLSERDTYGKAFLQISNLWPDSETVRRFVLSRRFGKIAADLLGVDGVRLYHDQALFKEPGGGPTPWHQDQGYWPLDTDKTITLWMPLVDVPAESGTMTFASGSHATGYLGDLPISDHSEAEFERFVGERGYALHNHGGMRAGDATFHTGWTLHRAPGNATGTMREVMTIIYFADGLSVAEPKNKQQEHDLRGWFPGLKPGDPAASEINPLVYSRR